jgi:hypothetical protein
VVIYKDTKVPIRHKCWHIHKIGKRVHRDFTNDVGCIPVAYFNEITLRVEEVVNPRGMAYATRNRLRFRFVDPYLV